MRYSQLLKYIKHNKWWSEEAPATYQSVAYPLHSFIEQSKYFHPEYLTVTILIFKDDFFYEESPEDEKYKIYQYIYQKVEKDKLWLSKLREDYRKVLKKYYRTTRYFEEHQDEMTNQQLWRSYKSFMDDYLDSIRYAVGLECDEIFTTYYLEDLVQKELGELNKEEFVEIVSVLSTPLILSFMEEERIDFLRVCIDYYKELHNLKFKDAWGDLLKNLKALSRNYFWILANYKMSRVLDEGHFFTEAKKTVKEKSKKELKQELSSLESKIKRLRAKKYKFYNDFSFSKKLKRHFYISEVIGAWIDERKKNMLIATHYIELYCQEISKRTGVDIWDIKYYLVSEIGDLLLDIKRIDKNLLKERREYSAYVLTKDGQKAKVDIYYKDQAKQIFSTVLGTEKTKKIKGQVASAPVAKIQGKVQVILDTTKQKFKKGNILVTTMTRPDFVPLMRQAKAIITDEGGLTCHAAIMSRELKIPCIIGVKVATKILQSGDRVELDLGKGLVKKI